MFKKTLLINCGFFISIAQGMHQEGAVAPKMLDNDAVKQLVQFPDFCLTKIIDFANPHQQLKLVEAFLKNNAQIMPAKIPQWMVYMIQKAPNTFKHFLGRIMWHTTVPEKQDQIKGQLIYIIKNSYFPRELYTQKIVEEHYNELHPYCRELYDHYRDYELLKIYKKIRGHYCLPKSSAKYYKFKQNLKDGCFNEFDYPSNFYAFLNKTFIQELRDSYGLEMSLHNALPKVDQMFYIALGGRLSLVDRSLTLQTTSETEAKLKNYLTKRITQEEMQHSC